MLPEITSRENNNYTCVLVGDTLLYFSYATLIAFQANGRLYVSENLWGATTGKHLRWLGSNDRKDRLSRDDFEKAWEEVGLASITNYRAIRKGE